MRINQFSLFSSSSLVIGLITLGTSVTHAADITNKSFELRSADCADLVSGNTSSVKDVNRDMAFSGAVKVTATDDSCIVTSNSVPNHNFNDGRRAFPNDVSEQDLTLTIPRNPQVAAQATDLSLSIDNAVFLNGVKLDLLAAACYGVGRQSLGKEKIGCGDREKGNPWRYDPLSPINSFATDSHHAHAQPDGTYHYHAGPKVLFNADCSTSDKASPVIGFAADGFPIYGSCISTEDGLRKVTSSYVMKTGKRVAVGDYETPETPHIASDNYDGQFRGDYQFTKGSGDLDECNGMVVDGQYGYYVTDAYPWVMSCFKGAPDTSFSKRRRR